MKWTIEQENFIRENILLGYTYKELSNNINAKFSINRTIRSVAHRCEKMGIVSLNSKVKTTKSYNTEILYKNIICIDDYINANTKIKHKCFECGNTFLTKPKDILSKKASGCSNCNGGVIFDNDKYICLLNDIRPDLILIDKYINIDTPILHYSNICNHEFMVSPKHAIHDKTSCPKCANYGFKTNDISYCYFIYFRELDLYKIGVSNNCDNRITQFGYVAELLSFWRFDTGYKAKKIEKKLHNTLIEYKNNTGKLVSGNTETFNLPINVVNNIKRIKKWV